MSPAAAAGPEITIRREQTLPIRTVSFSDDGRWLTAAHEDETTDLWELVSGVRIRTLPGHTKEAKDVAVSVDDRWMASPRPEDTIELRNLLDGRDVRLLSGHRRAVTALAFSRDGHWLASGGRDRSIRIWAVPSGQPLRTLSGHSGDINALAFDPGGRYLASAGAEGTLKLWLPRNGREVRTLKGHDSEVESVAFSPDGKWLASGSTDGTTRLWEVATGRMAALLLTSKLTNDWVVVSPDGPFDGSAEGLRRLAGWRFGEREPVSLESFLADLFSPGLLVAILSGRPPRPRRDITSLDPRTPEVKLSLGDAEGSGRAAASGAAHVRVEAAEARPDSDHPAGSGVRDVRLFRNGVLVKAWNGQIPLDGAGKAVLEVDIALTAGENRVAARAANGDGVRGADVSAVLAGARSSRRKGTAHLLEVSIGRSANGEFDLPRSVADTRASSEELSRRLGKLQTSEKEQAFERVELKTLEDSQATRSNILSALETLGGKVRPDDAVFVYFACLGVSRGDHFTLISHDLGYAGKRGKMNEKELKVILEHGISDGELEQAFEKIDAGQIVLVIDSCDLPLPSGSREKGWSITRCSGLAHLASHKGMYVLAAARGFHAAKEEVFDQEPRLVDVLLKGLRTPAADWGPRDGEVSAGEWLEYAARVFVETGQPKAQGVSRAAFQAGKAEQDAGSTTSAWQDVGRMARVFTPVESAPPPWILVRFKTNP